MSNLDRYYEELYELTAEFDGKISHVRRTVALFRVAIEYGALHMGVPMLGYMMSRLLAITLGVGIGSGYTSYDSILEEFDPEQDQVKH